MRQFKTSEMSVDEAIVQVVKDGKVVGELTPQSRSYRNFDHPNSEVSVIFSLGDELYATIHDVKGELVSPLKVTINPMVNWVWIGSVIICLFPLLALRSRREKTAKALEK
jgi:cytochrome c-type biogenesis protein CcmF